MKKLLLFALLLFAVPAHAVTYTLDFSAPFPDPYPFAGQKLYTQPIGPVTVTFGGVWRRGWDCDQPSLGNTCHPCTGQGHYVPTPPGGPPGRQREDDSGDFANEPSPGAVAWMPPGWDGGGGGNDSVNVTFSQVVNSASFWYSSSLVYNFWCYAADSCGYGQFCTFNPGPLGPNPGARTVAFFTAAGTLACDHVVLDQPGTRDETGCVGDPLGSACRWTFVQSPPLYNPANPIKGFRFQISSLGPFFMDDLTVGDPAPGPSLAHSTLDGAVVVVGNQLQAADPRGSYHPIIRDSLDHPLSGVSVSIAFPGHEYDTYFPSHGPNYSGPPAMYCNPPKFTQVTGANGEAHFTILGRRIGPDLSAVAIVSVNGSPWVTRPLAFVDIDGSGEDGNGQAITGSDFSFFQADFFSGQYRARADYNGNGVLDGNDYSDFLDYFFGGYVQGGNAFGFCTDINPKPPVAPALAIPAIPTFKRDGYYDVAGHRLDRPPTIPGLYWQVENGMPRKLRVR